MYIITALSPLYHTSEYEVRKEINILLSPRYTLGMSYTIFSQVQFHYNKKLKFQTISFHFDKK